jgi:hypothetical protein
MATPKELLKAIQEQRVELHEALHEVHDTWETKPAGAEGEDTWSPKDVAQHVIGAEWFFTNQIVRACGYPTSQRPDIDVSTPGKRRPRSRGPASTPIPCSVTSPRRS